MSIMSVWLLQSKPSAWSSVTALRWQPSAPSTDGENACPHHEPDASAKKTETPKCRSQMDAHFLAAAGASPQTGPRARWAEHPRPLHRRGSPPSGVALCPLQAQQGRPTWPSFSPAFSQLQPEAGAVQTARERAADRTDMMIPFEEVFVKRTPSLE